MLAIQVEFVSAEAEPTVLLIYSAHSLEPNKQVTDLQNWLQHFSTRVTLKQDQNVSYNDFLDKTHIVYLGQSEQQLSIQLKKLIDDFEGKKLVIGNNVNQLKDYDFVKLGENESRINGISLMGKHLTFYGNSLTVPLILNDIPRNSILEGWKGAEMVGALAVKCDKRYYSSINQFSDEITQQFIIELLHIFFESNHPSKKEILIVIDQINPNTNANHLETLLRLLKNKKASYVMAVSPVFINKEVNKTYHIKGNKNLIATLQKSLNGGYVLLDQQDENVMFEKGIQELAYHKIYPIGIYGRNNVETNYKNLIKISDHVSSVTLPDVSSEMRQEISLFGKFVAPNAYVLKFQRFKKRLLDLSLFSDRIVAISIPAYLSEDDFKLLLQLIDDIDDSQWLDLSGLKSVVQVPHVSIVLSDGNVIGEENLPFLNRLLMTVSLSGVEVVLWIIAILVMTTIGSFLLYIIWLRGQLRKRLFNERKIKTNG